MAPREAFAYPVAAPDSAGIPGAVGELVLVAPYNDSEVIASIVNREWRDIAAIIVEPVQRFYAAEPPFWRHCVGCVTRTVSCWFMMKW